MSIPNCTLTTSCFCLHKEHSGARTIQEIVSSADALLRIPVYLVIYGDSQTIPFLKEIRSKHGLESITLFVETSVYDLWSFQYLDKVRENRKSYFPTRDDRTSPETHLVTCNKFDFVLRTIDANPFQTTRFGWIDCFLGENASKICENYDSSILPWTLSHVSDKFHIQVLNVCDKKYTLPENKREYYSHYQWVVCGCLFTCGAEIGSRILRRLKDIVTETTNRGFGHGEEMFYLEVLEEFPNDLSKSYGDYGQILNNFIYPRRNLHYIYYFIVKKYMEKKYWREAQECSSLLVHAIENHFICDIPELLVNILMDHFISTYYHIPDRCIDVYTKIKTVFLKNPLLKNEFEKQYHRIEWYLRFL
jgi:hypothetical protein